MGTTVALAAAVVVMVALRARTTVAVVRKAAADVRVASEVPGSRMSPVSAPAPVAAFFDPVRPPGDQLRAGAATAEMLEQLLDGSGRGEGPWTDRAKEVFLAMKRTIPMPLLEKVFVKEFDCYRLGCMLTVVYATRQVFDQTRSAFLATAGFREWPAAKGHGAGSVTKAGAVRVTWLLMNPVASAGDVRSRHREMGMQ
jgi:hypothetical protein